LGASIFAGMLIGLIMDKIKALQKSRVINTQSPTTQRIAFKRKNSLRKYTQRKQSVLPLSEFSFRKKSLI